MTDPFIARPSLWRIVLLAGASLVFVIGGLWMAGVFGEPPSSRRYSEATAVAIGWMTTIFFGLVFVAITKQLFGDRELLVLNEQGLRSAQWSDATIPWPEIVDVTTWSYKGSSSIILHLRDRNLFPGRGLRARLAGANRRLTGGDIAIAMTATDKSIGETLAAIDSFRANTEKQNRF
jgi:hypothetical protein